MQFTDFNLNNNVLEAIKDVGYEAPTPIQEKAIPIILDGRDLVGCAQTGTGKTAAFAIPIINTIHRIVGAAKKRKLIRTIVLTPTRELAIQIEENFKRYSQFTSIQTLVLYGGVNQEPQVNALKNGIDVLVTTPGRFLDLYKQEKINLDYVHQLVIDEADLMLDMGFIADVRKIIKLSPPNRQTLLFSATMPLPVRELADDFMNNAAFVSVDPISSASIQVRQRIYFVEKEDKKKLLFHVISEQKIKNILIFVRTKQGVDSVVEYLQKNNLNADGIHGDKSQTSRQDILKNFKDKKIDILVATDVASRGIDIDALPYVINYDLPNVPETYVHRIGRTGRAGMEGTSISFCGKDEKVYWDAIKKLTRIIAKEIVDHPYPWKAKNPNAKTDFRNKKSKTQNKDNTHSKSNNTSSSNSRKSEGSKKNKKRWY